MAKRKMKAWVVRKKSPAEQKELLEFQRRALIIMMSEYVEAGRTAELRFRCDLLVARTRALAEQVEGQAATYENVHSRE